MSKKIRIENHLISDPTFPHHAFFLLVHLRHICVQNHVNIYTNKLLSILNWKKNITLKKYLSILSNLNITYFSDTKLPHCKPLQFNIILPPAANFTQVNFTAITAIKSSIAKSPEKAVRLYYFYTQKTNSKYKYAFPSYDEIAASTGLLFKDISYLNSALQDLNLINIQSGGFYEYDSDNNIYKKERNKYYVL